MSELLGLIDSIEATILESKKIPLTDKVVLEEKKILILLDKLRLAVKSNGNVIRESIEQSLNSNERHEQPKPTKEPSQKEEPIPVSEEILASQLVQDAQKKSDGMVKDTKEYVDYMMANLQLMVTKVHKNLMTMENSIETSRQQLAKELKNEQTK
ncbi:MAG: hypothetical protein HRT90_01650 [Candidatus Margulisbacteria bacterium]|nr:hypothetical protein [Candidatus Margulisiibacteriota bacterium]